MKFNSLFVQCVCDRLNRIATETGTSNNVLELLAAMEGLTRLEEIE